MKISQVLQDARWRIRKPDLWCQGFMRIGNRSCAVGALRGDSHLEAWEEAWDALYDALPPGWSAVARFNDHNQHADVLALYDVAISAALSDEAGE